ATPAPPPPSSDPSYLVLSTTRRPPTSPLFPYTTLFRSRPPSGPGHARHLLLQCQHAAAYPYLAGTGAHHGKSASAHPHRLPGPRDRKSTRLNSSHVKISYAVFCLKKKRERDTHSTLHHD